MNENLRIFYTLYSFNRLVVEFDGEKGIISKFGYRDYKISLKKKKKKEQQTNNKHK